RYIIEEDWTTEILKGDLNHLNGSMVEIPLNVPYMSDQPEFQSANLSFQENGIKFRVVKQRYIQDTLQLIFVPDLSLNKLDQILKGWMGTSIDGLNQIPDSNQALLKNFIKDYFCPESSIKFYSQISYFHRNEGFLVNFYQKVYIDLTSPPPEIS